MRVGGTGWAPMCMSLHWESWYLVRSIFPLSMASRMSWAHGTSSQTMVQRSSLTVRMIHSGLTPRRMTARLPERREPNQCILAPV